jgi:hypothetical protein
MKQWQQYQHDAATFFRKIGLEAKVDIRIEGVRGEHEVDVLVTGSLYGIRFTWVVECKAWQSNVPKEKVMALAAIVYDIGADRGFLLSEIGFQSGAIRQAERRNITLTSLRDLRDSVETSAGEQALARLAWRAARAREEIWRRRYEGGKYLTEYLISEHWLYLDYLSVVFDEASREIYPIVYKFNSAENLELTARNLEELISGIEIVVTESENYLKEESKRK